MQVSRDGKMPVAMFEEDEAIMSPAYPMFEVIDKTMLMPQYLMMWFSRSEFDREASYYAVGGVRGSLTWEDFCNMQLPIPSITRQREIVSKYETLTNRIRLNNQMIQHLEATAQALYRKTFVDNINKEDLPEGWRMGKIQDFGEVVTGKTPSTLDQSNFGDYMPFVTIPDMHNGFYVIKTERGLSKKGVTIQANKIVPKNSVCVSCIGTSGLVVITPKDCQTNQQINTIVPQKAYALEFIYLTCCGLEKIIAEYGMGAAVLNNLNKSEFENLRVIIPLDDMMLKFHEQVSPVFSVIYLKQKENLNLTELQSLLLAKMGQ